ncbi:MAG: hypothetical protein ACFFFB_13980 [Candidatus Heimdallarchaeota archaeon]
MKLSDFIIILGILILAQSLLWLVEDIAYILGWILGEYSGLWTITDTFRLSFEFALPIIILIIGFIVRKKDR